MVNKKFVVPYIVSTWYRFTGNVSLEYRRAAEMDDIAKALCFLCGTNYDNEPTLERFCRETGMQFGEEYEWSFFKIRAYKKGTMHFTFKSEEVWYKFNQAIASIRGWELPVKTKAKNRK